MDGGEGNGFSEKESQPKVDRATLKQLAICKPLTGQDLDGSAGG